MPDDYVTVTYTGTQIKVYGSKDPSFGTGAVSLDGGSETTINFFATTSVGGPLLWTSPTLGLTTHTLKLRVIGGIGVDRVDILVPAPPTASPAAPPQQPSNPGEDPPPQQQPGNQNPQPGNQNPGPFAPPLPQPSATTTVSPLPTAVQTAIATATSCPTPTSTPTCPLAEGIATIPGGQQVRVLYGSGVAPNIPPITKAVLFRCRPEAQTTLSHIQTNGPFPYRQDDKPFQNRPNSRGQVVFPPITPSPYQEYTVVTPTDILGSPVTTRAMRRLITDGPVGRTASSVYTDLYYTDDHYQTAWKVV